MKFYRFNINKKIQFSITELKYSKFCTFRALSHKKITKMNLKNTKRISAVLFAMVTLLVFSCRENQKTEDKANTTQTNTTTPVQNTQTPVKSADGVTLNPSHGQPGHRCDIAVGAPLDSKPAQINTNTQKSDVILDNNNTTTLPKGTLNPAHGQPGHNCAVKVGEPL